MYSNGLTGLYLFNALYSKDISRKVATALMAQQQNGTFRNRNLPYGYVWNEDKTAYAIDEEVAVHVKDIFRWKLECASINQILQRLEDSGVSNPEQRKRENTHPALVSQEDFDSVQAMLAEASAEKQRKKAESASIRASMIDLFDKRCFCGDCGKRMSHCIAG